MSYIGNDPSYYNLNVNKYSYTAYAGQTTFNAIYDTVVDVYLNGAKLQSGTDYTATDGVSVILTVAALENDVVDIAGYFNMTTLDMTQYPVVLKTANTGAAVIPTGNTASRPTGTTGYLRYNTDLSAFEGYSSGIWKSVVVATDVSASTTNTVTNKIAVTINGTVYYLLASTSEA